MPMLAALVACSGPPPVDQELLVFAGLIFSRGLHEPRW